MNFSTPLDSFPLIRSRDIEEVCEALGRIYARPALVSARGVAGVDAAVNNCQLQHIALAYAAYGAAMALGYPATGFFVQLLPIRGTAEIIRGQTSGALTPGISAVVSSSAPYVMNYGVDYAHLVLRIDARALTEKLAAMTGATIDEPLRMNPQQDFKHPAAQILQQYLPLLIDTLSGAHPPFPDWWIAQTEQFLMTLFLCGHRHNYSYLLEALEVQDAAPIEVRQAEEYVEANWQQAITLEKLAEVTGVSAFSLFSAFKKHRGYSPLEFATRLRSRHRRA